MPMLAQPLECSGRPDPPPAPRPAAAAAAPKGKAKGTAPPCKAKAKAKATAKSKAQAKSKAGGVEDESPRDGPSARLVNLHWRASLEPRDAELSASADPYLCGVVDYLPKWGRRRFERCQERLRCYERAAGLAGAPRSEPEDEAERLGAAVQAAATPAHPSGRRRGRRHTIFSGECAVEELPQHKLREFFQARSAAFDISARGTCTGVSTLICDAKHRQILDILVRKEAILRHPKLPQLVGVDLAVGELVDALHRCDYDRLTAGMLEDLRKVASAHADERSGSGQTVLTFVKSHGEDALQHLEHPHLHRLLYSVLQIPAVTLRLECMILEATFSEHAELCHRNLEVLHAGFECLLSNLAPLRSLFAAALCLGNALNRGSSAQVAGHGFKLCSLPKLLELRLPVRKEASLLHFALLWLPRSDVEKLCQPRALEALRRARAARGHTVYQDLLRQLEGFRSIQELAVTGHLRGHEVPRGAGATAAANGPAVQLPRGNGSGFHARMGAFAEQGRGLACRLWRFGRGVFRAYRDLAAFLDDFAVYPPPKEEQEDKRDLFAVFHQLFETIARVRAEVEEQRLPLDVTSTFRVSLPFADGVHTSCESLPALAAHQPSDVAHEPCQRDAHPRARVERQKSGPASHCSSNLSTECGASAERIAGGHEWPSGTGAMPEPDVAGRTALVTEEAPVFHAHPESARSPSPSQGRPCQGSPPGIHRQLEVSWSLPGASTPSGEPAAQTPAPLGPPPSRPAKRLSACLQAPGRSLPASRPTTPSSREPSNSPPRAAWGVLPLCAPLELPRQPGGECLLVTPTRSPLVERSPVSPWAHLGRPGFTYPSNGKEGQATPTRSPQMERTPTSPRTRLGRKSLTRIANRLTSEVLRVHAADEEASAARQAVGEDAGGPSHGPGCRSASSSPSPSSGSSSAERGASDGGLGEEGGGGGDGAGPNLQAQLWREVRRRRSRVRPGVPGSSPYHSLWAEADGLSSPATPVRCCYPLTPVKEQGETPYRLAGWQSTPT